MKIRNYYSILAREYDYNLMATATGNARVKEKKASGGNSSISEELDYADKENLPN